MKASKGCTTPEATSPQQIKPPIDNSYLPYRELVGPLQYLVSASRPDIAHAVRNLGKYLSNYTFEHPFMAKRVLRYLAHTVDYGLVNDVGGSTRVTLTCFTGADYANDDADRKNISGYVTMLNGNVVSYVSRKQKINAQSTTETEYVAMNDPRISCGC
ncbi:polyprotein [Phytophthora megakarya]|uniref:Polyprotein n=1 Tax=Phytophthora megakarya TaxID=4795 RepID=A0A225WA26_9STRA|nr:polyprotein [Phytophthora megakarya]